MVEYVYIHATAKEFSFHAFDDADSFIVHFPFRCCRLGGSFGKAIDQDSVLGQTLWGEYQTRASQLRPEVLEKCDVAEETTALDNLIRIRRALCAHCRSLYFLLRAEDW